MEGGGRRGGLESVEDEVNILLSGFQDLLHTSYNIRKMHSSMLQHPAH